jgi:Domain of unknown function (DUF3883)
LKWKEAPNNKPYPWPIIPIWTTVEKIPAKVQPFLDLHKVIFVLAIKPDVSIQKGLQYIKEHPEVMLFLRNVKKIEINEYMKITTLELNTQEHKREIFINKKLNSSWLIKEIIFDIPHDIRTELNKLSDYECPARLKDAQISKITFAAQLQDNKIHRMDNSIFFCYLPTQVRANLPYLVNADFLLNAERAALLDNKWNSYLFLCIAYFQFMWLEELASNVITRDRVLMALSSNKIDRANVPKECKDHFEDGFKQGLDNFAFIPSYPSADKLLKISEAAIDSSMFYKHFPELSSHEQEQIVRYELEDVHNLLHLHAIRKITIEQVMKELTNWCKYNKSTEFQNRLFKFLDSYLKTHLYILPELKKIAFVLTEAEQIAEPENLIFPSEKQVQQLPAELNIQVVNHNLLVSNPNCHELLKKFGVREEHELDYIAHIDKLIKNKKISNNNAITITSFIFELFKLNKIQKYHWQGILVQLPVLNKSGSLQLAEQCYLADAYQPKIKLEDVLKPEEIISPHYITSSDDPLDWKRFFKNLGAKDKVRLKVYKRVRLGDIETNPVALRYFNYLKTAECLGANSTFDQRKNHFISELIYIPFIHYLDNSAYAFHFWNEIVNNWKIIQEKSSQIEYNMSSSKLSVKTSFLQYYARNIACIPSTLQNGIYYKSTDLYMPSLQEPIGLFLTVAKISQLLTDEQAAFFGFKTQLSFNDCILLLEEFTKSGHKKMISHKTVLQHLLKLELNEGKKDQLQSLDILLLAQDGSLQPRDRLRCFAVKNKQPPENSSLWLKMFPGMSFEDIARISNFFAIPIVNESQVTYRFSQEPEETEQDKEIIFKRLPIIAMVVAKALDKDANIVLRELHVKLKEIKFFRVVRMTFVCEQEEQRVRAYLNLNENRIYYDKRWTSLETIDAFCKALASYLEVDEQLLSKVLKFEEKEDLQEWLKEQKFKIELLPSLEAISDVVQKNLTHTPTVASLNDLASDEEEPIEQETIFTRFSVTPPATPLLSNTQDLNNNIDKLDLDAVPMEKLKPKALTSNQKQIITTGDNSKGSMKNRVGNSKCGYIRHSVIGDRECGYTAFSITRQQALELLTNNLNKIRTILQPAIHELLLTEEFYKYLIDNNCIPSAISRERITQDLTGYGDNLNVLQWFLYYDVRDKRRDGGWSHPSILQALAHIRHLGLRIWRLGEQEQLVPHRGTLYDYAKYAEGTVDQWIDLLFTHGNHFDRLEIINETEELEERIYPFNSSQSYSKFADDSFQSPIDKITINFSKLSTGNKETCQVFPKSDPIASNIASKENQEIGSWGENLVFEKLLNHYANKYSQCRYIETILGVKLAANSNHSETFLLELRWHNRRGESGLPYDFTIIKNGITRYIEVKTTKSPTKHEFKLSINEYEVMHAQKERYRFFHVNNAMSSQPTIKKIKDPAKEIEEGNMTVEVASYRIKF